MRRERLPLVGEHGHVCFGFGVSDLERHILCVRHAILPGLVTWRVVSAASIEAAMGYFRTSGVAMVCLDPISRPVRPPS